jgi:hypothetical protein
MQDLTGARTAKAVLTRAPEMAFGLMVLNTWCSIRNIPEEPRSRTSGVRVHGSPGLVFPVLTSP